MLCLKISGFSSWLKHFLQRTKWNCLKCTTLKLPLWFSHSLLTHFLVPLVIVYHFQHQTLGNWFVGINLGLLGKSGRADLGIFISLIQILPFQFLPWRQMKPQVCETIIQWSGLEPLSDFLLCRGGSGLGRLWRSPLSSHVRLGWVLGPCPKGLLVGYLCTFRSRCMVGMTQSQCDIC